MAFFSLTLDLLLGVRTLPAFVPRGGPGPGVRIGAVTFAVVSTASARTEPASASPAGTASTAPWRAAPRLAQLTEIAKPTW